MSSAETSIELNASDEVVFIRVHGDLGTDEVQRLTPRFLSVTALRPNLVIIDLAQTEFISSLGMGAIVELRRGVMRFRGEVVLVGMRPIVAECFRRTGLMEMFRSVERLEDALPV